MLTFHRRTITSTFLSNIKQYLEDNTGIKITLHDGSKLEGYIHAIDEGWDFTGSTQQWSIILEFQPFDVDDTGTIGD